MKFVNNFHCMYCIHITLCIVYIDYLHACTFTQKNKKRKKKKQKKTKEKQNKKEEMELQAHIHLPAMSTQRV